MCQEDVLCSTNCRRHYTRQVADEKIAVGWAYKNTRLRQAKLTSEQLADVNGIGKTCRVLNGYFEPMYATVSASDSNDNEGIFPACSQGFRRSEVRRRMAKKCDNDLPQTMCREHEIRLLLKHRRSNEQKCYHSINRSRPNLLSSPTLHSLNRLMTRYGCTNCFSGSSC